MKKKKVLTWFLLILGIVLVAVLSNWYFLHKDISSGATKIIEVKKNTK
jgi:uncharacterized protein (UPF0333 family)